MKDVSALGRADAMSSATRAGARTPSRDPGDFAAQMGAQRAAAEQRTNAQRAAVEQHDAQRTGTMRDDARRDGTARSSPAGPATRSPEIDRAEQSRTAAMRDSARRATAAAQDAPPTGGPARPGAMARGQENNVEDGRQRLENSASPAQGGAERSVQGRAQAGRADTGRADRSTNQTDAADTADTADTADAASEPDRAADAAEPGSAKAAQADRAATTQPTAPSAAALIGNAAAMLAPWTQRAGVAQAAAGSTQKTTDPGKTTPEAIGKDAASPRGGDRIAAQGALPASAMHASASDSAGARAALPGAPGMDRAGGPAVPGSAVLTSGPDAAASFAGALAAAHMASTGQSPAVADQPAQPVYTVHEPVGTPQFAPAMSERVVAMLSEGIQTARITVSPPELGPVRIEVSLSGELASVAFSALQPDTRLAIEQSLPLLGEMLAERGLRLDQTQVDSGTSSFAQQGQFGQPGGFNEPHQRALSGGRAAPHATGHEPAALRTATATGRIVGSDRLDVFA